MNKRFVPKPLKFTNTSRTLAVKCYLDNLLYGEEKFIEIVKSIPKTELQIIAIKHDKSKKEHWHILIRTVAGNSMYVASVLKQLGIRFRDKIDDSMVANHGLETIGRFENYVSYLLHISEDSIRKNKPRYDIEQMISNLSNEELQKIVEGRKIGKNRLTISEMTSKARKAGYECENLEELLDDFYVMGLQPGSEKRIEKAYLLGAEKRTKEKHEVNRMCIRIACDSDYEIEKAFECANKALMETNVVIISETQDEIKPWAQSIIQKNERGMDIADYGFMYTYKGKYLIWEGSTYIALSKKRNGMKARTQCINCQIIDDKLTCTEVNMAVDETQKKELFEKFAEFANRFNAAVPEYEATKQNKRKKKVWLSVDELNRLIK